MNKSSWILPVFALLAAAQLAVPARLIVLQEQTLSEGAVFKFRTRPVDPADAFRGRYVWLSLEPASVKVPDPDHWRRNHKAYAVLGTDSNGFATVLRLDRTRPAGEPAVPVRTRRSDIPKGEVVIQWPGLDRYYMTERKAPAAETAYRQHSVRTNQACHVTVRVREGHAAIENLFIEDQPIHAWLSSHGEK